MRKFVCTMSFELHPDVSDDARKLLRAELAGRRWLDRAEGLRLPSDAVFMLRSADDHETADDLHAACARDLRAAAEAVRRSGRLLVVTRAWVHVSGGGTYGPVKGDHLMGPAS